MSYVTFKSGNTECHLQIIYVMIPWWWKLCTRVNTKMHLLLDLFCLSQLIRASQSESIQRPIVKTLQIKIIKQVESIQTQANLKGVSWYVSIQRKVITSTTSRNDITMCDEYASTFQMFLERKKKLSCFW